MNNLRTHLKSHKSWTVKIGANSGKGGRVSLDTIANAIGKYLVTTL